jgi:hypothetical protein
VAVTSDSDGTVARVEFYHGTTKIAEKVIAPFTYTWSSVPAGSYELRAVATDNRGATTTSSVATVAVAPANQAPVVNITSPAPGGQFLSGDPVPITVSASDADGSVVRVDYFAGSTLIGSTASAPFAWTWQNPIAGSVSLTAVATDDRGATSVSSAVAVLVLSDPISVVSDVSETSPAGAATFTASLAETGRPLRRVEFWADSMLLGKDTAANYQFTWNNPPAGTYGITAVAIDLAGNRYRSEPVTLVVSSMGLAAAAAVPANLPATRATGINTFGELELQVTGRAREIYDVWRSDDLKTWTLMYSVWNAEGSIIVEDEMAVCGQFYRFSPH